MEEVSTSMTPRPEINGQLAVVPVAPEEQVQVE